MSNKSTALQLALALFLAAVPTVRCFSAEPEPAAKENAKPKITISKETTYITQPLRPDGYPDYAAALNERMSAGVTPENNAAVLLQRAFGPNKIPKELRTKYFEQLGMLELSDEGDYFVDEGEMIERWRIDHPRAAEEDNDYKLQDEFGEAQERPWTEKEFPIVAEWLRVNEKPLALAIQASQKSKRFFPNIVAQQTTLMAAPMAHDGQLREVAGALATRAMLETRRGDSAAAWNDLLAVHRLARLNSRDCFYLISLLVGYALESVATAADVTFLHTAKVPIDEIKHFRAELKALPPLENPTQSLDLGERFAYLDAVCLAAREGFGIIRSLGGVNESRRNEFDAISEQIDWNVSLKLGNEMFDRLVAMNEIDNLQQRNEAKVAFLAEIEKLAGGAKDFRTFMVDVLTKSNAKELVSPRVANVFAVLLLPALPAVMNAHDRTQMWCEMDDVAFALTEYRAQEGEYPRTLTALVPKYLAKVPADTFKSASGPLGYRRDGDAYLMWTVARDGIDSNGRSSEEDDNSDDLVLRPLLRLLQPRRNSGLRMQTQFVGG